MENFGKCMENYGKCMENYEKCMENVEKLREIMENYGKLLLRYIVQKSSCLYSFVEVMLLRLNCVLVENLRKFRAHFIKFQGTFYIRCI